jgi:hypothetical protein
MKYLVLLLKGNFKSSVFSRRLLKGASWTIIGAIAGSGLNLLTMMMVARLLDGESYGQFILIQSSLSMLVVFAGVGIGSTAVRYTAELRGTNPNRLGRILLLTDRVTIAISFIVSVLLVTQATYVAESLLHSTSMKIPLSIAAFSIFFLAVDGYQKSVLIGFEEMQVLAKGSLYGAIFSAPIVFILTKFWGLDGGALGLDIMAMVQCAISRNQMNSVLKKFNISKRVTECLSEWKILRDFALPGLLAGAMVAPAHWVSQTMLANTANGFFQVAILGIAMQWFSAVQFIPLATGRIVLPILTERLAVDDNFRVVKLVKVVTLVNILVISIVALGVAFLSRWIMMAYGPKYIDEWLVLTLVVMVAILTVGATTMGQMLVASSRMWVGAAMNAAWAIIFLFVSKFLVSYGALGIVLALGVAYLFHTTWVAIWTWNHLKGKLTNPA